MELVEGVAEVGDVDSLIAQLGEIGATHECVITAFDARYLVGREHVGKAARLAKRAFRRGENVADDPAIEVLLYAAGRRQIDRALEAGVAAGEGPVVVRVEHAGDDWEESDRGDSRNAEGTAETGNADDEEQERAAAAAVVQALGPGFERSGVLGEYDEELIHDFFAIGETELGATEAGLAALVAERVTLLDVEK